MGTERTITIVGGGFSGLTLALELLKLGFQVEVLEANQWGGLIQTESRPGMPVETAANSFLSSVRLETLAEEIGCELMPTLKGARKRFIFRGRPRRWPLSLRSSLLVLFWILPRAIFNRKLLAPHEFESVEVWSQRVLNQEIYDYLLSPALQGIYAGDARKLSANLLLGYILKKKTSPAELPQAPSRKPRLRGSVAPRDGMGDFINKLKAEIIRSGGRLRGLEVKDLKDLPRPLVLAVPPPSLAQILNSTWSQVEMLNLARVTLGFKEPQKRIQGFGILFPKKEDFNSLGVLANSEIFAHRGSLYNESWILGGAGSPEILSLSDEEILDLIQADRRRALGFSENQEDDIIADFQVVRWPQGLTHYTVEHEHFLEKLQRSSDQIYLTGNFLGRLGLSKILEQNSELAFKLKELYG
jgi:protoporphyrinogen/coproporphyrinogen III oxidase